MTTPIGLALRSRTAKLANSSRPIAADARPLAWWQRYASVGLLVLCLANVNGILHMFWGVDGAVSALMLAAAAAAVFPSGRVLLTSLGVVGGLFIAFIYCFVSIGTGVALLAGTTGTLWTWVRQCLTSIIVIVPCAQFAYMSARYGTTATLFRNLAILGLLNAVAVLTFGLWVEATHIASGTDAYFTTNRSSGLFVNANEAGHAVVAAVLLALTWMQLSGRRVWPLLMAATSVAAVIATFSRGAMLLLLAALAHMASRTRRLYAVFGAMTMCLLVALFLTAEQPAFVSDEQWARVLDVRALLTGSGRAMVDDGGRAALLEQGIQDWLLSPIVGNGLGAQRTLRNDTLGVHNTFVMVLGEAGLISGIAFVVFLGLYFLYAWRLPDGAARNFLIGYGVIVVGICLQSHSFLESRFHNALLGVSFGLITGTAPPNMATAVARSVARAQLSRSANATA